MTDTDKRALPRIQYTWTIRPDGLIQAKIIDIWIWERQYSADQWVFAFEANDGSEDVYPWWCPLGNYDPNNLPKISSVTRAVGGFNLSWDEIGGLGYQEVNDLFLGKDVLLRLKFEDDTSHGPRSIITEILPVPGSANTFGVAKEPTL